VRAQCRHGVSQEVDGGAGVVMMAVVSPVARAGASGALLHVHGERAGVTESGKREKRKETVVERVAVICVSAWQCDGRARLEWRVS
jgi:hypothetical protein